MKLSLFGGGLAAAGYALAQTLPSTSDVVSMRLEHIVPLVSAIAGLVVVLTAAWKAVVWGILRLKGEKVSDSSTAQLVMGGLLAGLMLLGGCGHTPSQRLLDAKRGYTLALNTASDLRERKLLSDQAYWQVETARIAAKAALDTLDHAAASGSVLDVKTLEQLEAAVKAMSEALQKSNVGTTSQPAVSRGAAGARGDCPDPVHRGQGPRADAGGDRACAGAAGAVRAAMEAAGAQVMRLLQSPPRTC